MNAPFTITIDGRTVGVHSGESVLDAARKLAIDIPTLCYLEKCGPLNSCQVCLVKSNGKLVPSCGTKVVPGMVIESETEEVHEARRTALELLFSDHVGDCLSPCHRLCPLQLNIPVMLRHLQADRITEAALALRQTLPLAGVLGRLCHHPCEQGCRRGNWDSPAAIRDMEKYVADHDTQSDRTLRPAAQSGHRQERGHHWRGADGTGSGVLSVAVMGIGWWCVTADRKRAAHCGSSLRVYCRRPYGRRK